MNASLSETFELVQGYLEAAMQNFEDVSMGWGVGEQNSREIHEALDGNLATYTPRSFQFSKDLVLVSYMQVFDILVEEYYDALVKLSRYADISSIKLSWPSATLIGATDCYKLPISMYKTRWTGILERQIKSAVENGKEDNPTAKFKIVDLFSEFPYICTLSAATVIRNVIVHNQGRMNEINHERLQLCHLDERIPWCLELIYESKDALYFANANLYRAVNSN